MLWNWLNERKMSIVKQVQMGFERTRGRFILFSKTGIQSSKRERNPELKKCLALLLAPVMLCCLFAGCGKTRTPASASEEQTPVETPAEEAAEEPVKSEAFEYPQKRVSPAYHKTPAAITAAGGFLYFISPRVRSVSPAMR